MAQTLTSTRKAAKPISRTTSPLRSVSIAEVVFGHDTQRQPVFDRQFFHLRKSAFNSALEVAKPRMKSMPGPGGLHDFGFRQRRFEFRANSARQVFQQRRRVRFDSEFVG
jgi:hypothetical protein